MVYHFSKQTEKLFCPGKKARNINPSWCLTDLHPFTHMQITCVPQMLSTFKTKKLTSIQINWNYFKGNYVLQQVCIWNWNLLFVTMSIKEHLNGYLNGFIIELDLKYATVAYPNNMPFYLWLNTCYKFSSLLLTFLFFYKCQHVSLSSFTLVLRFENDIENIQKRNFYFGKGTRKGFEAILARRKC